MPFTRVVFLSLLLAAGGVPSSGAQGGNSSNSIRGPALGFVFDRALGAPRRVAGLPGAAMVVEPVLDTAVSEIWVSPRGDYLLARLAADESIAFADLREGTTGGRPLGLTAAVDRVALSPTGASAALFLRDDRVLRFVTGLPDAPALSPAIDVSSLPRSIRELAVSDDGAVALVGAQEREGTLYRISSDGSIRMLEPLGSPSGIALLPWTHDALVSDRWRSEILRIRDVAGAAERSRLAGEDEGIARPIAVRVSDDGRRAVVANAGSRSITVLGLEDGQIVQLPCDSILVGLYPLGGGSLFALNELGDGPLQVLDAAAREPRIVFVPPPSEAGR